MSSKWNRIFYTKHPVNILCKHNILFVLFRPSVFPKMPNGPHPCSEIVPWRQPNPSSTGPSTWSGTAQRPTCSLWRPKPVGPVISWSTFALRWSLSAARCGFAVGPSLGCAHFNRSYHRRRRRRRRRWNDVRLLITT